MNTHRNVAAEGNAAAITPARAVPAQFGIFLASKCVDKADVVVQLDMAIGRRHVAVPERRGDLRIATDG